MKETRDTLETRWTALPAAVAFSSALVDLLSWLNLGHFYSANITGDLVQTATYTLPDVHRHWLEVAAAPVFVVGLVTSYTLVRRFGSDKALAIRLMFLVQTVTLIGAAVAAGADRSLALGLLCVLTISISNATMNILDHEAPTTWALTANCVRAGVAILDLATERGDADDRARDRATWRSIWPTVATFLLGGITAVLAQRTLGNRAWFVAIAVTLVYVGIPWRPASRSTPDLFPRRQV